MVGRDEDVRERRQAIELARAPPGAADGLELAQHLDGDRLGLADDDGVDQPGERERVGEGEGTAGEEERVALVAVDAPRGDAGGLEQRDETGELELVRHADGDDGEGVERLLGLVRHRALGRAVPAHSASSSRNARSHAMPGVSMMAR